MRLIGTLAIAAAALASTTAAASAAPRFEIRNAAARVVVIPEARSDVKVEVARTNAALPLTVRVIGDRTVVDGGLRRRIRGCSTVAGRTFVRIHGLQMVSYDSLPQIVVRTPMDAHVAAGSAVFGSIGRAQALELSNAGCGDWTVANVQGELRINTAGSGDTKAGDAGSLVVRSAGSGDVLVRQVSGPVTVDTAGSGDVVADSVNGPLKAEIAGSGDVRVRDGRASDMTVRIAGSGDVRFGGTAGDVNAQIAGSGDVTVGRVTGQVKKAVIGSGEVRVGG